MRSAAFPRIVTPSLPRGNLGIWLDGPDPTNGIQTSGSNVTGWTDKSGNGNTGAVVGVPTLSTIGALKGVKGFSDSIGLLCGSGFVISETPGFAVYVVAYIPTATGANNTILWLNSTTSGNLRLRMRFASGSPNGFCEPDINQIGGSDLDITCPDSTPAGRFAVFFAGLDAGAATFRARQSGGAYVTGAWGNTGKSSDSGLYLGGGYNTAFGAAGYSFTGTLAEVAGYNVGHNRAQQLNVMRFLANKYQAAA